VVPGHYNEDQFNTNFDLNLRTADRLSMKFFFSNSNQDVPFFGATVPGFPALRSFANRDLAIAETHIFSPRAINQFRFGFSRNAGQGVAGGTLTDQDVGINLKQETTLNGTRKQDVSGGTIKKKHTSEITFKGYTVHASKDEPQYLIKSDKTDHLAMHKGSALKKLAKSKSQPRS
jgi:hypothetical protein